MTTICDGVTGCAGSITHLDEKGYAYCTAHGAIRKASGRRCRKLRVWELKLMEEGKPIPSYKPGPKPKGVLK